jgi:hypothetical protein
LGGLADNPKQVVILRLYKANLTTTFPVGSGPRAVVFDRANPWVASKIGNTVSKG